MPKSPNFAATDEVLPVLERSYAEVRELLPELPEKLKIWLINENPVPETGVSGFAFSPKIMTIDFDQKFDDKQLQHRALRATVFHESVHLIQGHTSERTKASYSSALDSALYEGVASVFERNYANHMEPYSDYSDTDPELLAKWRDELTGISHKDFLADNGKIWRDWAFYDHADNEQWKLYKTGTWLIDSYLGSHGNDILEAVRMQASEFTKS